ncbi:MAG: hypothetical protein VB018_13230 [Lachnospiraceae bacterium]|nr:hypothetical protein [Lachnospiraceae bacterium]
MLFKICPGCNSRYELGKQCPNGCMEKAEKERNKYYDKHSRDKDSYAVYHSKLWPVLTQQCKTEFNGLDIYQLYKYGKVVYGQLSHHIVTVKDDITRAYDISNLIYVSDESHGEIHAEYDKGNKQAMQDYLFKIIEWYKREYKG